MVPIVKLENISIRYQDLNGELIAIDDVSFDVFRTEFVSIVGPSGCGKTTILSAIDGLLSVSGGSISIEAVSYTHLDVYKRQPHSSTQKIRRHTLWQCR